MLSKIAIGVKELGPQSSHAGQTSPSGAVIPYTLQLYIIANESI